jgi:hypothetical protein
MQIEPKKVYTPNEVAEILRCGRTNVYDHMDSGDLARTPIGAGKKGMRVMGSAILAFLEARTQGGPKPAGTFKYLGRRVS